MSDNSQMTEYRLQMAEKQIVEQHQQIKDLNAALIALERKEEDREKKRLLWGIGALGSVVMAMASFIWNQWGIGK